ncbi:MAG: transporter, partial [Calditrichaeota bacterium]
ATDSLKALADRYRPLLFAWRARENKTRHMVSLAKKEYLPDFRLGIGYTQRDRLRNGGIGADFVTALVTVDVPLYWWRKQKKQVQEARYREKQVQHKYLDVRNQVLASIESVYNDLVKSAERVTLFEQGILPQANQSLQSAIAGYQTDKVDFLTLLNNEINLLNFELEYYRAISDYHISIARLEFLTGRDLFEHEIESGEEK